MDLVMVALHQKHYVREFYNVLPGIACRPLMHPTIRKSMILVHVIGDRVWLRLIVDDWIFNLSNSFFQAKAMISYSFCHHSCLYICVCVFHRPKSIAIRPLWFALFFFQNYNRNFIKWSSAFWVERRSRWVFLIKMYNGSMDRLFNWLFSCSLSFLFLIILAIDLILNCFWVGDQEAIIPPYLRVIYLILIYVPNCEVEEGK
jgi:hypothetical protein